MAKDLGSRVGEGHVIGDHDRFIRYPYDDETPSLSELEVLSLSGPLTFSYNP